MSVVLVRHGETEWSRSGRHTGRTDVPLTREGRLQATRLGDCLTEWRFDLVLSSPLHRAWETCRLAGLGDAANVRDDLREWDYGDYEGRTTTEIRSERPGWTLWSNGVPNGEMIGDVAARADRILAEVRAGHGDVAIFGHGHMLRILGIRWINLPPVTGARLVLEPATVSVLGYERETPAIVRWNQPCS
jgi:broad specificity phosphatase PhoE